MGIPRLFKWVSDRYPRCSQIVEETMIPEFDNLYLDMNGILHQTSHGNAKIDWDLSEKAIMARVFNYIDDLVCKIRPHRLIYMAVDGVAPRAKMNQQRARRFRNAREKERNHSHKTNDGQPEFDSNCITPGTEFMAKLTQHLTYFIHYKVQEDPHWQHLDVMLSSHEVPGEGEHKIMEYLSHFKQQPGYNPNTRHCLYGLDADLIMLGLCSHEPHFALLREEVIMSKTPTTSTRFILLHLSLVREYIQEDLPGNPDQMSFQWDLERVIDDVVLMIMLVGNDFLPKVPGFDISMGVLNQLFHAYHHWLLTGAGYLNDCGAINFTYLKSFLQSLDEFINTKFLSDMCLKLLDPTALTRFQKLIYNQVIEGYSTSIHCIILPPLSTTEDIQFVYQLAEQLNLEVAIVYELTQLMYQLHTKPLSEKFHRGPKPSPLKMIPLEDLPQAVLLPETTIGIETKIEELKNRQRYYQNHFHVNLEGIAKVIHSYIEGLQWVMNYYYHGVPSWSWFYPYHYGPLLFDLQNMDELVSIDFELGAPYFPFEQLMGVLPPQSQLLVPPFYRWLMVEHDSPIIDFYPKKFQLDLGDREQNWEAIVLIPFIDQERLVLAMTEYEPLLTSEERDRNQFTSPCIFHYSSSQASRIIYSSLPGLFPDLMSKCSVKTHQLTKASPHNLSLCLGVKLGREAPSGFPSFEHLHHGAIKVLGNRFNNNLSIRKETLLITLDGDSVSSMLNKVVYIGYPLLVPGKVKLVETSQGYPQADGQFAQHSCQPRFLSLVRKVQYFYYGRHFLKAPLATTLYYVAPFLGLFLTPNGSLVQQFDETSQAQMVFPDSLLVHHVSNLDVRYQPQPPSKIQAQFPIKSNIVLLEHPYYGALGRVASYHQDRLSVALVNQFRPQLRLDRIKAICCSEASHCSHQSILQLSRQLKCKLTTLHRITSQLTLQHNRQLNKVGLGLKLEDRGLMAMGYCRKTKLGWEFATPAVQLIQDYAASFPEIIQTLDNASQYVKNYHSEVVFPDNIDRMDQLINWISKQGINQLQLVSIGSESLNQSAIDKLQSMPEFPASIKYSPPKKWNSIPCLSLLTPYHTGMGLERQRFQLGHQVIVTRPGGKVPWGTMAIVIGITNSYLELLLSCTYPLATPLNGREIFIIRVTNLTQSDVLPTVVYGWTEVIASTWIILS